MKASKKLTVLSKEVFERLKLQDIVTSEIRYRNSSIPFNACTVWKRSKFKTQKLLRTTNPENFRSIGQILPKISYLKGEITPFEKNELSVYSNKIHQNRASIN